MRALSLFMVFSWLNKLGGSSIWTLGLFLGLFMRHGAYFMRPSPTNLLKRRWFYLLNYLFLCMSIKINPWACALASLVWQDLWLAPALPPDRPWQEFIWSASSLTLGLVPWLLWFGRACGLAPQPDRPWQGCSWLFFGSRLTLGLVSWPIWSGKTCGYALARLPDRPWQGFILRSVHGYSSDLFPCVRLLLN